MRAIKPISKEAHMQALRVSFGLLAVIFILISLPTFHLYGQMPNVTKEISEKQALHLLRTYLRSKGYDTQSAPLHIELAQDSRKGHYSNFYLYGVYVDAPQRLVTIGSYGVNGRTGDIWELIECKRMESKAIAALQKGIRESSGLSQTEINQLRSSTPCFGD